MPTEQTVQSFRVSIDGWAEILQAESPTNRLEERLLGALEHPVRLLRWAVVSIEVDCAVCEGAYLKNQLSVL